jgi:hypothetical protein
MSAASSLRLGSARAGGWRGLSRPAAAAGALAAVTLLLRVRDPHSPGSYGWCLFETVTGWHCPACGGLRAVNDLASGRVLEAVSSNALLVGLVPVGAVLWAGWALAAWRGERPSGRWRAWLPPPALLGLLLAFTLLRNLAVGGALTP